MGKHAPNFVRNANITLSFVLLLQYRHLYGWDLSYTSGTRKHLISHLCLQLLVPTRQGNSQSNLMGIGAKVVLLNIRLIGEV